MRHGKRTRYGTVRNLYNAVQYGMVQQYNTVQYGIIGTVWYTTVGYNTIMHAMVWYSTIRYGTVWYGMVQYNTVWYSMIWYVQYDSIQNDNV